MQLSKDTLDVLKNFSNVNPSIVLDKGNRVIAFSNDGAVLANAEVNDTFDARFGIFDLNSFLQLVDLIEDPTIDTSKADKFVTISGSGSSYKFFVADESMIKTAPTPSLSLPSKDAEFVLKEAELKRVTRAASILQLETVQIFSKDGGLYFGVSDPQLDDTDTFSVRLADYEGVNLNLYFASSKFQVMSGSYNVTISHSSGRTLVELSHSDRDLCYWTSPESNSTVGS